MIQYRFYLKDNNAAVPAFQEIDEPKGWDGAELNLVRSPSYEGLENIYSGELSFYNYEFSAFDLLVTAYDRDWFDADVTLKITISCEGVIVDTIEGYLNFVTYEREGNEIKLQFEESSFARKFKNRIDSVVNIGSTIGIDGNELTDISEKTVLLHSKKIVYKLDNNNNTDDYDPDTFEYRFNNPSGPGPAWISPPNQFDGYAQLDSTTDVQRFNQFRIQLGNAVVKSDAEFFTDYNLPNAVLWSNAPTDPPINGQFNVSGSLTIELKINMASLLWVYSGALSAGYRLDGCDPTTDGDGFFGLDHFDYGLVVKVGNTQYSQGISSGDRDSCSERFFGDMIGKNLSFSNESELIDDLTRPFDASELSKWDSKVRFVDNTYTYNFEVNEGDELSWWIEVNTDSFFRDIGSTGFIYIMCQAWAGQNQGIKITLNSLAEPSEAKGYMVYEALNRVAESITGQTDAIRSDYFGRPNSVPHSYSEYGCESLNLLTSGKNIRNMLQEDNTPFPISASFSELFQALNVHNNLGVRVERDGSEYRLRIEPKEYFYQRTSIFTATEPSGLIENIAKERLYNDFEVGYNQWEIESVNGIDEPNTKHFYTIPTVNIKNKLTQVTNFITGGYAIEATRRVQFASNPTTDWKYDDNKFIISLNRIEVESDQYTEDETTETYAIGTVSERDELFTTVDNLISPETGYNLRFSPARAAINWYKTLAPALLKKASSEIKFASGLGNVKMITELTEDCSVTNGPITEDQDISDDDTVFAGIEKIALYSPIWISFEYPLNYSEFVNLRDNSNKGITVICGDRAYFGFVEEINYKPNTSGGIADFKLLVANCYQGGFDSGFTQGFDITQC